MTLAQMRKIGWAVLLAVCTALWLGLTLHVNSIKSDVRLAERRIVALQEETLLLETEFETRANQAQLSAWNTVDFGFEAPRSGQFLESERQLAMLGTPRAAGAPAPIQVAGDVTPDTDTAFPLIPRAHAATGAGKQEDKEETALERLVRADRAEAAERQRKRRSARGGSLRIALDAPAAVGSEQVTMNGGRQ